MFRALALAMVPTALLAVSAGQPAPPFKVLSLEGQAWSQAPAVAGCVLVDFWASWCQPCVKEIPALNALQAKYGPGGRLSVLGLSLDEGGEQALRASKARLGITYPVALVNPGVAKTYGVEGFPSAFLLRKGKVVLVLNGKHDLDQFERELGPYLK